MDDLNVLRQECERLMTDHGYFKRGGKKNLARQINTPYQSFIMALSGYREGPKYIQILQNLKKHLSEPAV
jgi:hypothetical protein